MTDIDKMSKDELLDLQIDPRIKTALKMFELSVKHSRAYAETVDTEEKRLEQIDRIQNALDRASYLEASAYWSPNSNRPLKK